MKEGKPVALGVILLAVAGMVVGLGVAWHLHHPRDFTPEDWAQSGLVQRTRMADSAADYLNREHPGEERVRRELGPPDAVLPPKEWHYHLGLAGPSAFHPGRHWLLVEFVPGPDGQWHVRKARAVPVSPWVSD